MSARPVTVSVVLPCYNEEQHVVDEVERICRGLAGSAYGFELIAVDDGSTDRTLPLLREAAARIPEVRVLEFGRNRGPGAVRRIGTRHARGEFVVWTDADMTYPNDRIPELVRRLDRSRSSVQVVGARTSEQGRYRHLRATVKWCGCRLAELLTEEPVVDLNSGFRAFRRSVALPFLRLLPDGFSCVTTLTMAFLMNRLRVEYVPISYARRSGTSKFHVVRDAYRYFRQILRTAMYFTPRRVLVPAAVALVVVAAGLRLSVEQHIGPGVAALVTAGGITGLCALRCARTRGRRRVVHDEESQLVDPGRDHP